MKAKLYPGQRTKITTLRSDTLVDANVQNGTAGLLVGRGLLGLVSSE